MTKVIGLFAGPGAGKSTTAAKLFVAMKERGYKVELVQEYVKGWAWEGKQITALDQFYLMAKQMRAESRLYGNVDYIITDSPIDFTAYYDHRYNNSKVLYATVAEFMRRAKEQHAVTRHNVFVIRDKPYRKHGRYETEEQARDIDREMKDFVYSLGFPYQEVKTGDVQRIIKALELTDEQTA